MAAVCQFCRTVLLLAASGGHRQAIRTDRCEGVGFPAGADGRDRAHGRKLSEASPNSSWNIAAPAGHTRPPGRAGNADGYTIWRSDRFVVNPALRKVPNDPTRFAAGRWSRSPNGCWSTPVPANRCRNWCSCRQSGKYSLAGPGAADAASGGELFRLQFISTSCTCRFTRAPAVQSTVGATRRCLHGAAVSLRTGWTIARGWCCRNERTAMPDVRLRRQGSGTEGRHHHRPRCPSGNTKRSSICSTTRSPSIGQASQDASRRSAQAGRKYADEFAAAIRFEIEKWARWLPMRS